MKHITVLAIDHTKANLFLLRPAERPKEQWSPILQLEEKLINKYWFDQKNETLTGGNRFSYHVGISGMAQTMHGYDDHLSRHRQEINKKFTRDVNAFLKKFISIHKTDELLIVSEKKILGQLRDHFDDDLKKNLRITEVTMNLANFSAVTLHEHLAKKGALPERTPPINAQSESFARSGQWRRRSSPSEGREESSTGHETTL